MSNFNKLKSWCKVKNKTPVRTHSDPSAILSAYLLSVPKKAGQKSSLYTVKKLLNVYWYVSKEQTQVNFCEL